LFCLIMIFGVALTSLVARPLPACASPATPAIAVGDEFVYALDDNGQVWAWGSNDEGQLGDGFMDSTYESNADSAVPVQVSNMSDATAIAAGNLAGYALKSDGTVWTWGYDKVTNHDGGSITNRK
jgi:alpha-tubulin suppressor-like RCC1 family protein